jgi:CMP-N,N'-diacetyllegionaminic acid synthase
MTTEDLEIARIASENGAEVPFRREAALAEDYAADFDIVVDALDRVEAEEGHRYDFVVMLQPTTPFTRPEDIDGCVARLVKDSSLAACFTVKPVSEPAQWMFIEGPDGRAQALLEGLGANAVPHKQLLPKCWFPSGAAYAMRTGSFRQQKQVYATPFAMQPMLSERAVDIDDEVDFLVAQALAEARGYTPVALAERAVAAST